MTTIDPQAAESARRIYDPLARAAITAEFERFASYTAGVLAGLDGAASDRGLRVAPGVTTYLCRIEENLTEAAALVKAGDVYSSGLRVAA